MMTGDQFNSFAERFLLSFEKIAAALEGLNETHRKQVVRQFPERGEHREAVVTTVPSEEDRIRAEQGASAKPIEDWLSELAEEEDEVGIREREWLQSQKHGGAEAGN